MDIDSADIDGENEDWTEPLRHGTQENIFVSYSTFVPKMEHRRTIIHFDIDCFYAQVEMLRNPELRNKPLGIQQKNLVITTNYLARSCGVPKTTYVADAKKICPELVLVCGEDLTNYRQMSYQISEFFQKYSPCVERLGFDENFVDVSELVAKKLADGNYKDDFVGHVYGSYQQSITKPLCSCGCNLRLKIGSQIAADIREALLKELGITCCAGVGCNKLLAKLVAGTHKPNQQTSVLPDMALELLSSLSSVLCIPGIGHRTSSRLNALGISTVQDLQASDKKVLEKEFGSQLSEIMFHLCYGIDDSPVTAYTQPQTLSDEDSFKCCNDLTNAERRIRDLLASLMKRVIEDGRVPQTIRLAVRRVSNKYHRESKQCPVPGNIFTKSLQDSMIETLVERLMPLLMNLFCKLVDPSKPFHLTLISICFAKLMKPVDELGTIDAFLTRGDTFLQHAATNSDLNEVGNHCEDVIQSSLSKSEVKTKCEAKIRITNFFQIANNTTRDVKGPNLVTPGQSLSQIMEEPHETSQPVHDVNDRLVSCDITNNLELEIKGSSLCTGVSYSESANCDQVFVTKSSKRKSRNISEISDRRETNTELNASVEILLQNLLPADVDVHAVTELPMDVQAEVLLQYGIFVEELPQGKRYTKMSDKVRTRSHGTDRLTTFESNKIQENHKEKNSLKINKKVNRYRDKPAARLSKKRKILSVEEESSTGTLTSQNLNVGKVLESSTEISTHPMDKSLPYSTAEMCLQDDVSPSTSCCFTGINLDHSVMEKFRENCSDDLPACSKINSMSTCMQSDSAISSISNDQFLHTPLVIHDPDTDNADLDIEHVSQSLHDISANSEVPLSNTEITNQTSRDGIHAMSHQSNVRGVRHHKLPANIDSEVFLSLPSNIRGEIMAHLMMGTSDSSGGQNIINTIPEHSRDIKHKNIKQKNQNTLLTYFQRK